MAMPHTLDIKIPLPPGPLASYIARALSVDPELSKDSVLRSFSCSQDMLEIHYSATSARMLRVAVNGAIESVRLCVSVAAELSPEALDMEMVDRENIVA
ncbi:transcription factor Pcc1-domain-containing protein [Terfezia claveryi]|nr:transcription factor Pcc1-domain-containing protein [Terfezia claveryi]